MTGEISLSLVFHQHQPVGNYDWVFRMLYEKSYDPLLSSLERHAGIRAGLHYTGPLLDWLNDNEPGYLARVGALVQRGQVELLGGGYYEPVLPSISEADRAGQIGLMRQRLKQRFGVEAEGAWLAERVWTPDLPRSLSRAGVRWTLVDDVHFQASGFDPEHLAGPYLTEYEGETVYLFPSSTKLRYLIPWDSVDACIEYLRQKSREHPGGLLVMGDDGEKFGGWPTTYKHCWEDGWVDSFFERVERESDWLHLVTPGQWLREHRAAGLAYLPAASYMEMGEWSLPPGDQRALEQAKAVLRENGREDLVRFVRGSHWMNFMVRYPEANLMHKRVQQVSRDAQAAGNAKALDHVWQAECNCPYWHGVFGGVYLGHIRDANMANVAAADALLHPGPQPADRRDWDMDGLEEVCLRSGTHTVVIDLADGEIQHWELPGKTWHLTHVVASRPEAYHEGLSEVVPGDVRNIHDGVQVKDPRVLEKAISYDSRPRLAAQDVVGAANEPAWRELRDRISLYEVEAVTDREVSWTGEREGQRFAKTISADSQQLRLTVSGPVPVASEWNLSLPVFEDGSDPQFELEDGALRITTPGFGLHCEHGGTAWVEPVHSISNTEGGVELARQGWCIVFFPEAPADGHEWNLSLTWSVV